MEKNAYIAIGSNIGDRELNLLSAIAEIGKSENIRVTAVSAFYQTSPVGKINQPDFFNAVIKVNTSLNPDELLHRLLQIETEKFGRIRVEKWGERKIDLDLLLYEDMVIDTENLKLPHPLMHERKFVMRPLADIAPDLIHPLLKQQISAILASINSDEKITLI